MAADFSDVVHEKENKSFSLIKGKIRVLAAVYGEEQTQGPCVCEPRLADLRGWRGHEALRAEPQGCSSCGKLCPAQLDVSKLALTAQCASASVCVHQNVVLKQYKHVLFARLT